MIGPACLLALALWLGPEAAGAVQVAAGLEYEDNPFEAAQGGRGTWVHRLYIVSSGRVLDRDWSRVQVRHQWGFKRYGRSAETDQAAEVVASRFDLKGVTQLHPRMRLDWGGQVKLKDVRRIPTQESYLRGAWQLRLDGDLGEGFRLGLSYRRSGDSARDSLLDDLSRHAFGLEFSYARSRRLQARLGLNWNRLNYDRAVLEQGFNQQLVSGGKRQTDRLGEVYCGVQLYRGMLADLTYSLLDNRSNSLGFGYRAHRVQLLLSRPLGWGVDGQLFLAGQRRAYEERLSQPPPDRGDERDEYAQSLLSVKLARPLGQHYAVSGQYLHARNGSRQGVDAYRKNSYGVALELNW